MVLISDDNNHKGSNENKRDCNVSMDKRDNLQPHSVTRLPLALARLQPHNEPSDNVPLPSRKFRN